MIVKNATYNDMQLALQALNKEYDNNIKFKRLDSRGTKNFISFTFTLTVVDSLKPGAKYNHITERRIHAACWHVHGRFFDILLSICPKAIIETSLGAKKAKIYIEYETVINNWKDSNVGSYHNPMFSSSKCHCQ